MLLPAGVLMFAWNLDGIVSIAIIAVLAVIICFMAILYLSSVRLFVEFTSIEGNISYSCTAWRYRSRGCRHSTTKTYFLCQVM